MFSRALFCSSFLLFCGWTVAEIIPLAGRSHPTERQLFKRQQPDDTGAFGNGSIILYNTGNTQYSCNLSLSGREYNVLIDTGSTDLFLFGAPPNSKSTGVVGTLAFGQGVIQGHIETADLKFDSFSVPDQAFLLGEMVQDFNNTPGTGLLGLGPSNASTIRSKIGSTTGLPVLDRIFRQNMTTPNFITVLLSRDPDVSKVALLEDQQGVLTIGETVPEFSNIVNMPKLPGLVDEFGVQHWQTLLDSNGIIGPDGKKIATKTVVPQPRAGSDDQLHVIFDTGFSLPQLPAAIHDQIYGRIPGAQFSKEDGLWIIPCDYEVNATFLFGGQEYPMSPLDMSIQVELNGKPICASHFQQTISNIEGNRDFGALDAILGMAFLRNTYMLINFGDFVNGSPANTADPYIQLVSTIDKGKAHQDFVNARLSGKDTTGKQKPLNGNVADKTKPVRLDNGSHSKMYSQSWVIVLFVVIGIVLGA